MNQEKQGWGGNEENKEKSAEFFQENAGSDYGEPEENNIRKDQQVKKLVSIIILLAGLFVGSLFIDVVQAITGNGFSLKNLGQTEIFEAKNKTWVAYSAPVVKVKVITDEAVGVAAGVHNEALICHRSVYCTPLMVHLLG